MSVRPRLTQTLWILFFLSATGYTVWAALYGRTPPLPAVVLKAGATLILTLLVWRGLFDNRHDRALRALALALPLCIAGDILLGIEPVTTFFLPGLGAFLVAYAIIAVSLLFRLGPKTYLTMLLPAAVPGAFFLLCFELAPEFVWPVRVFIAVQTCLLATAFATWARHDRLGSIGTMLGAGAALLYASDAILGAALFSLFAGQSGLREALVLATYYAGLALVTSATLSLATKQHRL